MYVFHFSPVPIPFFKKKKMITSLGCGNNTINGNDDADEKWIHF